MINNIINKVATLPRIINRNNNKPNQDNNEDNNDNNNNANTNKDKININITTTHGRDKTITNIINTMPNKNMFNFKHIKRAAPSLDSILCRTKQPSLGAKYGPSTKCRSPNCKCCKLMSNKESTRLRVRNKRTTIRTAAGNCQSKNIVYLVMCKLCHKPYTGKTTQHCHCRMNQHRWCFSNYIKHHGQVKLKTARDEDNYALGIHLYNDHGLRSDQNFDDAYEVYILEVTQPRIIDIREHMWIHRLQSLTPSGINLASTYGLPMLSY